MTMTENVPSAIRIAAIGDLLLTTRPGASIPGRGLEALSDEIRQLFASCDLVLANLECTLPGIDQVSTEPRVFTSPEQLQGLVEAGITAVTLGNNHAFDAGDEGFQKLTEQLTALGLAWFGAGLTLAEATKPLILDIRDLRIAIVGTVDESSGMYRFAEDSSSGVAPQDMNVLLQQIKNLRQEADHVIVAPHWGEERFRFPSPRQIEQAHALVDAGASMVLGHHPHVAQGVEFYRQVPIAYSLGNFVANEVYWDDGDFLTWNRFERTGCILLAELHPRGIVNVQQIPVFDDGITISIETSGWGEGVMWAANQMLKGGVTPIRYQREAFRVHAIRPIVSYLKWAKLRHIRPKHIRKFTQLLFRNHPFRARK